MGHMLRNEAADYQAVAQRRFEQRITKLGYVAKDPAKWFTTTATGVAGEDPWRAADRTSGPLGYDPGHHRLRQDLPGAQRVDYPPRHPHR